MSVMSWVRRLSAATVAAGVALVMSAVLPTGVARAAGTDPFLPQQWGMAQVHAPDAWRQASAAGVRIGIVDSGVDLAHQDLAGKIVAHADCVGSNGSEAACNGQGGQDDTGHGTHVAGIAAADTGNGIGVAGMAPDAQLVVAKVLSYDPTTGDATGSSTDVETGIKWAVDHGARVVNLSLGGNAVVTSVLGNSALQDGVEYAWSHGAVPVLAAGNDYLFGANYGQLDAIVVAATGPDGNTASYSSPTGNAKWSVGAPGGNGDGTAKNNIISTWWDRADPHNNAKYAAEAGTSMATPHVAGAVALLLGQGLSPSAAVQRILTTADPIDAKCGCRGRLDVGRAVGAVPPPANPTTPSTAPGPARGGSGGPQSLPAGGPGLGSSRTPVNGPAGPNGSAATTAVPPQVAAATAARAAAAQAAARRAAPSASGNDSHDHNPIVVGLAALLLLGVAVGLAATVRLRAVAAR